MNRPRMTRAQARTCKTPGRMRTLRVIRVRLGLEAVQGLQLMAARVGRSPAALPCRRPHPTPA